jgi:hypothetical protein
MINKNHSIMKKLTTILLLGLMLMTTYCTKDTTDPINNDETEWQIKMVIEPSCSYEMCNVQLLLSLNYDYDDPPNVNWGDGTINSSLSHIYAEKGLYTIKISNTKNTIDEFRLGTNIKELYFKGITIRRVEIDCWNSQNAFSILDIDDCEIEYLRVSDTKIEHLDLKGIKKLSELHVSAIRNIGLLTLHNLHTCNDLTILILGEANIREVSLPECSLLKELTIVSCTTESVVLGHSPNLYYIDVVCNRLSASNIISLLNHWYPRPPTESHRDMFMAWGNPGWPAAESTVNAQTSAKVGVGGQYCNCPCLEDGSER